MKEQIDGQLIDIGRDNIIIGDEGRCPRSLVGGALAW